MEAIYRECKKGLTKTSTLILGIAVVALVIALIYSYFRTDIGDAAFTLFIVLLIVVMIIALYLMFLELITEVYDDRIVIQHRDQITIFFRDMTSHSVMDFKDTKDYGSTPLEGIRNRSYIWFGGHKGVEIVMKDGSKILIGSDDPEALNAAISM